MLLAHTLQDAEYMKSLDSVGAECHEYTDDEVYQWNFYLWCSGFFLLGLQFTHGDVGPLRYFTFTWSTMKLWGPGMWGFFVVVIALLGAVIIVDLKDI